MFGSLGGAEILLILVLALLLLGPRSLPQVGRTVGRALGELRRATHDFRSTLEREVQVDEIREVRTGLKTVSREIQDAVTGKEPPKPPAPPSAPSPTDESGRD